MNSHTFLLRLEELDVLLFVTGDLSVGLATALFLANAALAAAMVVVGVFRSGYVTIT